MKRKFLVGLLCLAVLLIPSLASAAGITSTSFSSDEITKLRSFSNTDNVEKTVGNVTMLKSISKDFIVLTYTLENTTDTYSSILATLKNILSDGQYNYFVSNYKSITTEEQINFTGFQIYQKPAERTQEEIDFGKFTGDIVRVAICVKNLEDVPSVSTPTTPTTPTPTTNPTDTEVTNPSTGDANVVLLGAVILVAVAGSYYSIRKIREN